LDDPDLAEERLSAVQALRAIWSRPPTVRRARVFPDVVPMSYQQPSSGEVRLDSKDTRKTAWSDALVTSQGDMQPGVAREQAGMILERRE